MIEPDPLSRAPWPFGAALGRALVLDPADRPLSARAMRAEIQALPTSPERLPTIEAPQTATGETICPAAPQAITGETIRPAAPPRPPRPGPERAWTWRSTLALCAVLAGVGALAWGREQTAQRPSPSATASPATTPLPTWDPLMTPMPAYPAGRSVGTLTPLPYPPAAGGDVRAGGCEPATCADPRPWPRRVVLVLAESEPDRQPGVRARRAVGRHCWRYGAADDHLGGGPIKFGETSTTQRGHLYRLAFSPDGLLVAGAAQNGSLVGWQSSAPGPFHEYGVHHGAVWGVRFTPDGALVATASQDGTVRLVRPGDGYVVWTWDNSLGPLYDVAFSPDGRTLVAAGEDSSVDLVSVGNGDTVGALDWPGGCALSAAYSPDGRRIAVGGLGGEVRIYDAQSAGVVQTLRGSWPLATRVVFSPGGDILAVAGGDGLIWLCRMSDGALLQRLAGHANVVTDIAFSPDGRLLVSGSYDGTVRLWDLDK